MEYYFNPNQQRTEFIMFVHHQRKHYLLFPVLCLIYQICSIDAFKHNMNLKKRVPLSDAVAIAPTVSQHMWYFSLQPGYFENIVEMAFFCISSFSIPLKDSPWKEKGNSFSETKCWV